MRRLEARVDGKVAPDHSGQLFFVDGDRAVDLGVYVYSGWDLHPAVVRSYVAELFDDGGGRLVVSVAQHDEDGDTERWFASEDDGATWAVLASRPSPSRSIFRAAPTPKMPW